MVPPKEYSVDLNNDGRPDTLTWKAGPGGGAVDPVLNAPRGQSHFVKAPPDLRVSAGRAYSFTDKKQTGARFHASQGLMSFAVGQNCGYHNKVGMVMSMRIDGIAFEIRPAPFNHRNIPDANSPVQMVNGKVLNRAYEMDGDDVFRQFNTDQLFWMIRVGASNERIDLNRVMHNDKCVADDAELERRSTDPDVLAAIQKLSVSEKLIQHLLRAASKLGGKHTSTKARRVVALKLEKIAAQWKVKHPQSDPRVKQITDPILWNGILGAMAKLAGLTPADFPG